jgi:hypothetical protein
MAVIPCDVILETGDRVDYTAITAFQRQAFANVHAPIAPASVQTSAYYAWKYRTPWGPARVATVTYGGDAASMVVTWRFRQRPGVCYARIKVDGADAVVRQLDDGAPHKLVIMRICVAKPEAEQHVLRAVMGYAAACRARFVIYLDSAWQGSRAPLFIRVPSALLPRPMPIVAREFPDCLLRFDAADWDVL